MTNRMQNCLCCIMEFVQSHVSAAVRFCCFLGNALFNKDTGHLGAYMLVPACEAGNESLVLCICAAELYRLV